MWKCDKLRGMSENLPLRVMRRRPPRLALVAIALTATACATALVFRTSLRSRLWAYRVEHAATAAQRAVYVGALCNAGDQGRWGVAALLASADADVRQYGVLVLQHVRSDWARQRLLDVLIDPDETVRRLAAVGLAIQRDELVIPALKGLYQAGDESSAVAACLALERLGTRAAIVALGELALEPADVDRRAALIDALDGIGTPECVPTLLHLLSDHRACDVPPRSEETTRRALGALVAAGVPVAPSSPPTSGPQPHTVAERAALVLNLITHLDVPFSSAAPAEERSAAERQWTEWTERHP